VPVESLDQFVREGPLTATEVEVATRRFKKAIIERALGAELSHQLGYVPPSPPTESSHLPHGVTHILSGIEQPASAASVTALLLDGVCGAEHQRSSSSGLALAQAGADIVADLAIDVVGDFPIELPIKRGSRDESSPPAHDASPFACRRMPAIAAISRSQLSDSRSIACRPLRVSR
jgi:hypothetical protein